MTDTLRKIIPLADMRYASRVPSVPARLSAPTGLLGDTLGRPLRDLRISVTDRCNFRCSYCMPSEIFDRRPAGRGGCAGGLDRLGLNRP